MEEISVKPQNADPQVGSDPPLTTPEANVLDNLAAELDAIGISDGIATLAEEMHPAEETGAPKRARDGTLQRELQDQVRDLIKAQVPNVVALVAASAQERIKDIAIEEDIDTQINNDANELVTQFMMGAFESGALRRQANLQEIASRAINNRLTEIQEAAARAAGANATLVEQALNTSQVLGELADSSAAGGIGAELMDLVTTPTDDAQVLLTTPPNTSVVGMDIESIATALGVGQPQPATTSAAIQVVAAGGSVPGATGPIDLKQLALRDPYTIQRVSALTDVLQSVMQTLARREEANAARPVQQTGTNAAPASVQMFFPSDAQKAKEKVAAEYGKAAKKSRGKGKAGAAAGAGASSSQAPPIPMPVDQALLKDIEEKLLQLVAFRREERNRRIQPVPGQTTTDDDGDVVVEVEDPCANNNAQFVINWAGRDDGVEVPMPLREEVEIEFPGEAHADWRAWIEYIRTLHPGNAQRRSGLDPAMRDDLMYGQCDVPEMREGSGAFVRQRNGMIAFSAKASPNTGVKVPLRYPKADGLGLSSARVGAAYIEKHYRRVMVKSKPAYMDNGTLLFVPVTAPSERYRVAAEAARALRVGNFDENGQPVLVSKKERRIRQYREGYAVITPIRLNRWHWEYQYARGLANPLVEPSSRTPVVPRFGYKSTDPALVGKVAPAVYNDYPAPAMGVEPCASSLALPLMPTRSMGDKNLRRDKLIQTDGKKNEPNATWQARMGTERAKDNFLNYMPTESVPHDLVLSQQPGQGFVPRSDVNAPTDPNAQTRLVDQFNFNGGKPAITLSNIAEAKLARRKLWAPHHFQNTTEYPMRSGGGNAVEFDMDPVAVGAPGTSTGLRENQNAVAFVGFPTTTNEPSGQKGRQGPGYVAVHLYDTVNNKLRWDNNTSAPRSGTHPKAGGNKPRAPEGMRPPTQEGDFEGIPTNAKELVDDDKEKKKNKDKRVFTNRGLDLEPQWIAPVSLGQVVDNFLANHYDAFQYQRTREDLYDLAPDNRPRAHVDKRPAQAAEGTEVSKFNSEHRLIHRPLKGEIGKGALMASLRLDIGPQQGCGGLDSFLPVPPQWNLRKVSEKGVRGFHEIWADSQMLATGGDPSNPQLSARSYRNGAPFWYKQELTSMLRHPTCPWMQGTRDGEGILPAPTEGGSQGIYSHLPVEFMPPERIGLTAQTMQGVLELMALDRRNPQLPEIGGPATVAAAAAAAAGAGDASDDDAFENALVEAMNEADATDNAELEDDMAQAEAGATAEATGLVQTAEEQFLDPGEEEFELFPDSDEEDMDEDDPIFDQIGQSAGGDGGLQEQLDGVLLGSATAGGVKRKAEEREGQDSVLVFPLYVTFFDRDDFDRARYQIDAEWHDLMKRNPHYFRWADRFRLVKVPGSADQYTLEEGYVSFEDPITREIQYRQYVSPQEDTPIRKEGDELYCDGDTYGFTYCRRPRERYVESWRRDRREFGRPFEPKRLLYVAGREPIVVGDEPGTNPQLAFEAKVLAWTAAWNRRAYELNRATVDRRLDEELEYLANITRSTVARISWFEGMLENVNLRILGPYGGIQAMYFAVWIAENIAAFFDAATRLQQAAQQLRVEHAALSAGELNQLADAFPRLGTLAKQDFLPWIVPTAADVASKLPRLSEFVHGVILHLRGLNHASDAWINVESASELATQFVPLEDPIEQLTQQACLSEHLAATRIILKAAVDHDLENVYNAARTAFDGLPESQQGGLIWGLTDTVPTTSSLETNLVDNMALADLQQLELLYGYHKKLLLGLEPPPTFDALTRHCYMAEVIVGDPPLLHLVDTTILAGWPVEVPRSQAQRDKEGVLFMSVIDLIDPFVDEIELARALLYHNARFKVWVTKSNRTARIDELLRVQFGFNPAERAEAMAIITDMEFGISNDVLRQEASKKILEKAVLQAQQTLIVARDSPKETLLPGTTVDRLQDIFDAAKAEFDTKVTRIQRMQVLKNRLLLGFKALKSKRLSDELCQRMFAGRSLVQEFLKRITEPPPAFAPNQSQGYYPTAYVGSLHSGIGKVRGIDEGGYIRLSEACIVQGMGNFFDAPEQINVMAFDGGEIYGPKGQYFRYVVARISEWVAASPQAQLELPMAYRAWYDSPQHQPSRYVGADPVTGRGGWPRKKHPGRSRSLNLTSLQRARINAGITSKYEIIRQLNRPTLGAAEYVVPGQNRTKFYSKIDAGQSLDARNFVLPLDQDTILPVDPSVAQYARFSDETSPWYSSPADIQDRLPDVENPGTLVAAYEAYRQMEVDELKYSCTTKGFDGTFRPGDRFSLTFSPFKLPYLYVFQPDEDLTSDPRPNAEIEVANTPEIPMPDVPRDAGGPSAEGGANPGPADGPVNTWDPGLADNDWDGWEQWDPVGQPLSPLRAVPVPGSG